MPLFAEDVPEDDRTRGIGHLQTQLLRSLEDPRILAPGLAQSGKIALYVRKKNGSTDAAEALGQPLQGDGLSGSRCACNETVTIRHPG
jgi:hypothetical protein